MNLFSMASKPKLIGHGAEISPLCVGSEKTKPFVGRARPFEVVD